MKIAPGIHLVFRRNTGPGTWSVHVAEGGVEWLKKIGLADDHEPAAPPTVLNYWQAIEAARRNLARHKPGVVEDASRPPTVAEALDRHEAHLTANGGDSNNLSRVRRHLPAQLAGKAMALLDAVELKRRRDALAGKLTPASINRTATVLKAALSLFGRARPARQLDRRKASRAMQIFSIWWRRPVAAVNAASGSARICLPPRKCKR